MLNWTELKDRLQRELKDTESPSIFSDTELGDMLATAITEYSRLMPREWVEIFALEVDQDTCDLPAGCRGIIRFTVDSTGEDLLPGSRVFAGQIILAAAVATADTATMECHTAHTIPTDGNESSTYEEADEASILKYARGEGLRILAGEGARYFHWKEGVQDEDRGKTQKQLGDEATTLQDQAKGQWADSAKARTALQAAPATRMPLAKRLTRKADGSTGLGIYKTRRT